MIASTSNFRVETRRFWRLVTLKNVAITLAVMFAIHLSGIHLQLFERDFDTEFAYPMDSPDFHKIVQEFRYNPNGKLEPHNKFYSQISFEIMADYDCHKPFDFLLLVKSSPQNRPNREVIRKTWMQPPGGISVKTVFFLGKSDYDGLDEEIQTNEDIVVIDFVDSYYNNTIKMMLEIRWALEDCPNFEYALLVDDDYFVSVKNLHQFAKEHASQDKLYAGLSMFPKPLRHRIFNKWFVSLSEYPYNRFPPYITAGAILLSKPALQDIHFASFFVKPFRFDDIYVAICAKKMNLAPTHSDNFRFWERRGELPEKDLIVSHGFREPERLLKFWTVQSEHGFV